MAGTRVYILCLNGWSWSSSGSGLVPKATRCAVQCGRPRRLRACARCACVCVCVIYKSVPADRPAVASLQPPAPPSHRYNQPTRHRPARHWPGLPSSRRRPSRSLACRSGTPTGSARRAPGAMPSRPSPRTRTCADAAAPRCTRRRRRPMLRRACVRAWSQSAFPVARTPERKPAARPPARPPSASPASAAHRPRRATPCGAGVLQRARVAARSCCSALVLQRARVAARSCSSALVLQSSRVAMLPCCTSRALKHASCCSAASTHSAPVSAPSTSVPSGRNSAHSSARASDSRFEYLQSGRRTPCCDYSYP
jgi:hypothetical protein